MSVKLYLKRMMHYIKNGDPNITPNVYISGQNEVLKGKNILVTGGGRGLGYSIAKKCISSGASVLITGRNVETLQNAQSELGLKCHYMVFDISSFENIDIFFDDAEKKFGERHIDAIVNNAGISLHEKGFIDVTYESWDKQMDTNLKGTYFFTQAYIKYLLSHKSRGNILIVSSERGLCGDTIPYGISKSGLNCLIKGLSIKYIAEGIRVNGIAPGVTASDMTGISKDTNLYNPECCGKRYFLPEEIAEVAAFLLGETSNCISGEIIACDQGNYLSRNWGL